MKYYYISGSYKNNIGSSSIGVDPVMGKIETNTEGFWNYEEPIILTVYAEEKAKRLF